MILLDNQNVTLSVSGTDVKGNPVDLTTGGTLTFTVDDDSILTLTDNGDGTASIAAVGPLGTATVTVSDDTDVDGTPNFQGSLAVDVVASGVTGIVIEPGTPTDQ